MAQTYNSEAEVFAAIESKKLSAADGFALIEDLRRAAPEVSIEQSTAYGKTSAFANVSCGGRETRLYGSSIKAIRDLILACGQDGAVRTVNWLANAKVSVNGAEVPIMGAKEIDLRAIGVVHRIT